MCPQRVVEQRASLSDRLLLQHDEDGQNIKTISR